MSDDLIRPFRWDVSRVSELGSLARTEVPPTYPTFEADLRVCAARTIASAGDSDLIFVGRSPEPLFHLISGVLAETTWSDRLDLFNVSLRGEGMSDDDAARIEPYLEDLGLSPARLLVRARPVAFVDVVASGETFGDLIGLLHDWSRRAGVEWRAVARKLRIVGLTWRTKTSPKTWRWQAHVEAVRLLEPGSIKNVSIHGRLFSYLASAVPKTTAAFPPSRWTDPGVTQPVRDDEALQAVALSLRLYNVGRLRETRRAFARALGQQHAVRERWLRALALEVKR